MREIKFRMFDTEEKEFMSGSRVIESRINALNKKGRFIFQQYTGLKDSKGVDIYEGDVVQITNIETEITFTYKVGFLYGCFVFGGFLPREVLGMNVNSEVIGNIYEK